MQQEIVFYTCFIFGKEKKLQEMGKKLGRKSQFTFS